MSCSCGDPTRTDDLKVMSLASYQLLHPAMLVKINDLLLSFSVSSHHSCGSSTRTNDLKVMSLASYQLLHPAILRLASNALSLEFECKDSNFFHSFQIFLPIFLFYVIFGHQNGPFGKLAADKPWNFSTGCTAAPGAGTLFAPLSLSPSAARSVAPRPTCPAPVGAGRDTMQAHPRSKDAFLQTVREQADPAAAAHRHIDKKTAIGD